MAESVSRIKQDTQALNYLIYKEYIRNEKINVANGPIQQNLSLLQSQYTANDENLKDVTGDITNSNNKISDLQQKYTTYSTISNNINSYIDAESSNLNIEQENTKDLEYEQIRIYKNVYDIINKQNNDLIEQLNYLNNQLYFYDKKYNDSSNDTIYYENIIFIFVIFYYFLVAYYLFYILFSDKDIYYKIIITLLLIIYPFSISYIENFVFETLKYIYCMIYGVPYKNQRSQQTLFGLFSIPKWFQYKPTDPIINSTIPEKINLNTNKLLPVTYR